MRRNEEKVKSKGTKKENEQMLNGDKSGGGE